MHLKTGNFATCAGLLFSYIIKIFLSDIGQPNNIDGLCEKEKFERVLVFLDEAEYF